MLKRSHVVVPANLLQFLKEWLAWTDRKVDNGLLFNVKYGLCMGYSKWCGVKGIPHDYRHLSVALRRSGLDTEYPFGKYDYSLRSLQGTMHLCPQRREWVKKIIEDNQGVS